MRHLLFFCFLSIACCCIAQSSPGLIPFHDGDKWGYSDSNGKIIIQPQWDHEVSFFSNGYAAVKSWGTGNEIITSVIDPKGNYLIPPSRNWTGWTGNSFLKLNTHDSAGNWGVIDSTDHLIIPYQYQLPTFMYDPLIHVEEKYYMSSKYTYYSNQWKQQFLIVRKGNYLGVIDDQNRVRIPFLYKDILPPLQKADPVTYFIVTNDQHQTGVIDANGQIIVPLKYSGVTYNEDPYNTLRKGFFLHEDQLTGWADLSGPLYIEPRYTEIYFNPDSTLRVSQNIAGNKTCLSNLRYGLLDKKGKVLLPVKYCEIYSTHDSIVAYEVKTSGRTTMITTYYLQPGKKKTNVIKSPPNAFPAKLHSEPVCGQYYEKNTIVIPEEYQLQHMEDAFQKEGREYQKEHNLGDGESGKYSSAVAYGNDTAYAIVDKNKRFVIPPQSLYHFLSGDPAENIIVAEKDGLYGLVDTSLNILLAFQPHPFDVYFKWGNEYYALYNNRFGRTLINASGKTPPAFEHIFVSQYLNQFYTTKDVTRFDGYFNAFDTAGKMGIVGINGQTVFPGVSFKHPFMEITEQNLIMVWDVSYGPDTYGNKYLVDQNNVILFPNVYITTISGRGPLYRYNYVDVNNDRVALRYFYADQKGRVFARDPK